MAASEPRTQRVFERSKWLRNGCLTTRRAGFTYSARRLAACAVRIAVGMASGHEPAEASVTVELSYDPDSDERTETHDGPSSRTRS